MIGILILEEGNEYPVYGRYQSLTSIASQEIVKLSKIANKKWSKCVNLGLKIELKFLYIWHFKYLVDFIEECIEWVLK